MDNRESKNVVNVMKDSFINYAMDVIIARALPDLRDGLKPVHRRILYTMYEDGLTPDKAFRKSATTVGAVLGKYHPHGDTSVYDAMVRMAQDFSYRHPLVDGHGNFGSVDGYGAAAYRYTEARLSKISLELLRDINKNTVDFVPNFDQTKKEPVVIPSRFPNILVNGTMGIAVGMATNIPPHNLGEVIDGCVAYIDDNDITVDGLMKYIKGPDFPTGAAILGNRGIKQAYETGRGTITIRAHAEIIEHNGKQQIVFTDIPYQVTKMELQKRIAELVRDKVLEGITDLHDESTLTEIKLVVHLKKEANANVVLNNLYKHTSLQTTYGIIFLMLDQGLPKTLNLKEIISKYIDYQREVIYRRTKYDLEKAEKRVHILEGYKIALDNLDAVINIIRNAKDDETAKHELMTKFSLDDVQAESILELKLRRLTGLERSKIEEELNDLLKLIDELKGILASDAKIYEIIKQELLEIKAKYADERRTEIDMTAIDYIDDEALIPEENIVVALTNKGYIKRTTSDTFKSQNRGGVGVKGMTTNEEDFVEHLVDLSTHDYLLFFTNKGKVYRLKGYEIPQFGRQSKGLPIINLLQIDKDERISSVIKISANDDKKYLLFVTKCGIIKKTSLTQFENIRQNGKIAITLKENDELIAAKKTSGNDMVLIGSSEGRMVKFTEDEIRDMGRTASGVKGIDLEDDAIVVSAEVVSNDDNILLVTENGYGKQTKVADFRQTRRGSKGVKALNITDKNGKIADFKVIGDANDVIIVTNSGMIMRMPISQISVLGRITQGVRLINLKDGQKVSTITLIKSTEQNEEESTFSDNNIEPRLDNVQV
ncbi:dNA gyrase subunit A [Mycoplasma sp. CAG:956]|nr:dNA gyrase subunit A [Mycoplasma sp. CAG:956]